MTTNCMAYMSCIGLVFTLLSITSAQTLPFAFGNSTKDTFLGLNDNGITGPIFLAQPMAFLDRNVSYVTQANDGFIGLDDIEFNLAGFVLVYRTDIDTRNGGVDQNQVWLRVGNRTDDLDIARDIIAGRGTSFSPQAMIICTWNKVEANPRQVGPQNTFQLAMAYGATGETWVILAYEQLQFFQAGSIQQALVEYRNSTNKGVVKNFFTVTSNAIMTDMLNGSNCKRSGIYAHRVNGGAPTKAPTKVPTDATTNSPTKTPTKVPTKASTKTPTKVTTKAPTVASTPKKCGLFGRSIFCPLKLCGVFGRWSRFCKN